MNHLSCAFEHAAMTQRHKAEAAVVEVAKDKDLKSWFQDCQDHNIVQPNSAMTASSRSSVMDKALPKLGSHQLSVSGVIKSSVRAPLHTSEVNWAHCCSCFSLW